MDQDLIRIYQGRDTGESVWPALVVDLVEEEQLRWTLQGRIETASLPTAQVHVNSTQNMQHLAVLSWRWDVGPGQLSRNLQCAVRYAKTNHIAYLLVDTISINQRLSKNRLIQQVLEFSKLFRTFPVLAAYDNHKDGSFEMTLQRPWILSEVHSLRYNPYPVTYLQHMPNYFRGDPADFLNSSCISFLGTVLSVLSGRITMADYADFQYVLPALGSIIRAAFGTMSLNDYLLTIAIFYMSLLGPVALFQPTQLRYFGYSRYSLEWGLAGSTSRSRDQM